MRARAIAILLTASALAVLLPLPAAAGARPKPASRQQRPEVSEELGLYGTDGFKVTVTVKDRRRVTLAAVRFGAALEGVSYRMDARQPRGSDDIVARIGRLGRVDVRFVPHKVRREKPPRGCRGEPILVEEGDYVGLIAFHGEHGFTRVRARRAPGKITRTPALRCATVAPPPNPKQIKRELEAIEGAEEHEEGEGEREEVQPLSVALTATARGHHIVLKASKVAVPSKKGKGFALTNFSVIGTRDRGKIKETGLALLIFERGSTILIPDRRHPTSEAVVKPPAPFTGSATFRRGSAKRPTWTGSLKVNLPGFGVVPLAGRGTRATMCGTPSCFH